MPFALDTDTLTLLFRGHEPTVTTARRKAADELFVITAVNRIEVLTGRFESVTKAADGAEWLKAYERLVRTEEELAKFPVLPVNPVATALFDRFRTDKRTKKVKRKDLLIACIALAHAATLVTRNTKDFAHIPNLKLENWAA